MDTRANYKERAINSLSGKWGTACIATLIMYAIMEGVSLSLTLPMGDNIQLSTSTSIIWSLLCLPLEWGFAAFFLRLIRNEDISYGRLFDGYKDFARIFCTKLLYHVYVMLWSVLFIIPGIIKMYSYAMTDFILKDEPELKNNAAIEKSMQMMEGHKTELFLIDLSLIGWLLLSLLTLGLGLLLLLPYYESIHAHFYEDLKKEQV